MDQPLQPFNLLAELLISILVIALLAAMALPLYQGALERSRMVAAWSVVPTLRAAVIEEYASSGHWPTQPPGLELLGEHPLVAQIDLHPDAFTLTFNQRDPALAGHRLTLRYAHWPEAPLVSGLWLCAGHAPPAGMHTLGVDQTDLPPHILPTLCQ